MLFDIVIMVPAVVRYIDPLFDFSFKKLFGSKENKAFLISFLNELFEDRKDITDIVYGKNDHPGDIREERGAIFDVLCTNEKGEKFLIEVQRGRQENFGKRLLYYASRQISSQAEKGMIREDWEYEFTKIYVIAILGDFTVTDDNSCVKRISLCDEHTGEIFSDDFGFIFVIT